MISPRRRGRDIWVHRNKTINGEEFPYDKRDPNHRCEDCDRPLKARLIKTRKKPPKKCYKCFCKSKGKLTGQERRKLKKKGALRALAEEA